MNRTELNSLGEFGMINRISQRFPITNSQTALGIGDDAAAIKADGQVLVSKDLLLEGVHFDLSYFPLKHLGFKAVTVGISDIIAMNAVPTQVLIGVAMSNRFSVEALDELYSGIKAACDFYQVDLVGGDTTSSRSGLVISVTAIGMAKPEQIVKRSTAKAHDIICLTGDIGAAYLGLQVLEREKQVFLTDSNMQPELSGKDYVLERQLRPQARLDWLNRLRALNIVPTSMIDVSDGLASEILHLCGQSKTGAIIYEERLPIDNHTFLAAEDLNINPLTAALNGGEDFELLFTVSQADYAKIEMETDLSIIGYMSAEASVVDIITKSGNSYPIKAQGFKLED